MNVKNKFLRIGLPVLILLAGFLVMRVLILNRPLPQKADKPYAGALVEVLRVVRQTGQIELAGTGIVQAGEEIAVTPQVSGLVKEIAPGFVAGGFFKKGEPFFAIEAIDYELLLEKARAGLAKAESELAIMESKAKLAWAEWERMAVTGQPDPLVVYEPQLHDARANLAAAKAAVQQAQLDLDRTGIKAPFNCRIRSEQIGPGQYVRAGSSVADIVDADVAEIIVPLPLDELRWLNLPARPDEEGGSAATVRLAAVDKTYQWQGVVARTLGEVDPKGRMVRIVVRVPHPYNNGNFDLTLGLFVEVVIHGQTLTDIIVIPRHSLRQDSTVWIMDAQGKLRIRPVRVVRFTPQEVWIGEGLAEGDHVVLTSLAGGAEGLQLRLFDKGEDK